MKGERILNRDGKKKLNRQNLMILIVDLVLIIIFIGGFGWGIGTVKRYQVEPNTHGQRPTLTAYIQKVASKKRCKSLNAWI